VVWWPSAEKTMTCLELDKVQRLAYLAITGAMRTATTRGARRIQAACDEPFLTSSGSSNMVAKTEEAIEHHSYEGRILLVH